jgi:hypothetical protein
MIRREKREFDNSFQILSQIMKISKSLFQTVSGTEAKNLKKCFTYILAAEEAVNLLSRVPKRRKVLKSL